MITFLNNKIVKWLILIISVPYIMALFFFYQFSNQLIFQGTRLTKEYKFDFAQPFEEHFISTPDGTTLNALLFSSAKPTKGLIFYLHGNADNLERWGKFAIDFTKLGYDVLMYDYRGYGKSTGVSNDQNIHTDATFVLNWIKNNTTYRTLIIYGRSLGSAVASKLAINGNPDLLILETPFADFKDVIYWLLKPVSILFPMKINFSNRVSLPKVTCPKVIFHGTNDWVVPLSSAQKLKPFLTIKDQFIIIDGAGHRNMSKFESYHLALAKILE